MKPLKIAAFSTVAGLAVGLALACGGLGSGSEGSYDYGYSKSSEPAPGAEGYPSLDRAYRVAPDRGVVAVKIALQGPSRAEADGALTKKVAEVIAAVTAGGAGCAAAAVDYDPVSSGGDITWRGTAEVRVDIDLRQLADVEARRARVDACVGQLEPLLTTEQWRKRDAGTERVLRSGVVLSVDEPDTHRDALLAREQARLTWAASAAGAPQLHPEDLRCVPDGTVQMGDRRLSGVVLTLGMNCRIGVEEPPKP